MTTTNNVINYLRESDLDGMTAGRCASDLGVPLSTLRKFLIRENSSFKSLLDAERKRRCDALITDRKPYSGLVQRVTGYNGNESVTRAFRRWYGCTLKEFKARQRVA